MKIVLITRDRPELTKQTIETMVANATNFNKHQLVIVFDGTGDECAAYPLLPWFYSQYADITCTGKQLGVGGAKNFGVKELEIYPDDDILMFSDNDMYYLPNWDERLEVALDSILHNGPVQLGGWKHPFHGSKPIVSGINEVDAATGNCFVIRYKDWLEYGPFDANAIGPGQSEDFALSQKINNAGGLVATLDPPVAIHCGLRNSMGEVAVGWQEMAAMAEKQLIDNNISKIWLETPDEGTILLERLQTSTIFSGLNVGSGQRRFTVSEGWTNVDCTSRPPDQVPDVVCDATKLVEQFGEDTQDMIALVHNLEHYGCGEGANVIKQCYNVLKPGGSLIVIIPDLKRLAGRWLSGEISEFIFNINTYGAFQGHEGDRHRWSYSSETLPTFLQECSKWTIIKPFDYREIPGSDYPRDWWMLAIEAIK